MSDTEINLSSVQHPIKTAIDVPAPSKVQVGLYLTKWEKLENYQHGFDKTILDQIIIW